VKACAHKARDLMNNWPGWLNFVIVGRVNAFNHLPPSWYCCLQLPLKARPSPAQYDTRDILEAYICAITEGGALAEPERPKKVTAKPAAAWVAKPTYAWRSLVIGGGIPVTGGETAHCSFKPFSRPASLALNSGRISFTTWLPPVRSQPKRPGRMFLYRNQ
jgi:hypothetical protein